MSFYPDYAQARAAFLSQARAQRAYQQVDLHPLRGKQGEELAVDVAVLGQRQAAKRLLVTSGCHGVEGVCGSAIQVAAMQDHQLIAKAKAANITLVFGHALNPYGFSFWRRVTENNVDLNRNFQDFSKTLPVNAEYDVIHPLLIPEVWPPPVQNQQAISQLIAEKGMGFVQEAVSGGQYSRADGLFYGGTEATWSNRALHRLMGSHCKGACDVAWVDLHTGLGPTAVAERIFTSRFAKTSSLIGERQQEYARARAWWSKNGQVPLTNPDEGTSSSAPLTGVMVGAFNKECAQSRLTKITLEFGTVPLLQVLQAMRGEHWANLHPEAPAQLRETLSKQMLAAFFVDTPEWKSSVIKQGLEVLHQTVEGLGALQ
jgi:predicted deacylase